MFVAGEVYARGGRSVPGIEAMLESGRRVQLSTSLFLGAKRMKYWLDALEDRRLQCQAHRDASD
jgi:hypothetical protein